MRRDVGGKLRGRRRQPTGWMMPKNPMPNTIRPLPMTPPAAVVQDGGSDGCDGGVARSTHVRACDIGPWAPRVCREGADATAEGTCFQAPAQNQLPRPYSLSAFLSPVTLPLPLLSLCTHARTARAAHTARTLARTYTSSTLPNRTADDTDRVQEAFVLRWERHRRLDLSRDGCDATGAGAAG
jgi:hypothetical protein